MVMKCSVPILMTLVLVGSPSVQEYNILVGTILLWSDCFLVHRTPNLRSSNSFVTGVSMYCTITYMSVALGRCTHRWWQKEYDQNFSSTRLLPNSCVHCRMNGTVLPSPVQMMLPNGASSAACCCCCCNVPMRHAVVRIVNTVYK